MAVKILMVLEGVPEVEAQLKRAATAGENALAQFQGLSGGGGQFDAISESAKNASQAVNEFGGHTTRLSEVFHILRPALQAAGVQIGEFGSLARIAGGGIAALAVAATGAVIVAFARLEETLAATKGRLTDLFGSQAAGEQAFSQLEKNVKGLGVTVGGLEPALESAKTALDRFIATTSTLKFVALPGVALPAGTAQNLKNVGDAVVNFFKLLRAGRLDATEAEKADKAFFDTLKEGGTVTASALKNLPTGTVELLAQAMNRGQVSAQQFITEVALAPIPVNKLIEALARFGPQSQEAFNAKAVKGFGDSFNELLKVIQEGSRTLSGVTFGSILISGLDAIKRKFEETNKQAQLLHDTVQEIAKDVPPIITRPLPEIAPAIPRPRPSEQEIALGTRGFIFPTAQQFGAELDKIDQEITPKADEMGHKLGELIFGKTIEDSFTQFDSFVMESITKVVSQLEAMPPIDFSQMFSLFEPALNAMLTSAQSIWQQIQNTFGNPILVSAPQFTAPGGAPFASGGMVRGPGSGTSDSILAWLSDKEFVINARAVSHYGPDLFAALNAMRLPRDFLSRFNMGGLVRAIAGTMPHFASGGMVGVTAATAPVTFVIDRQPFDVRASDQTIAKLRRYAITSQLSSAGRKPSWVK